MPLDTPEPEFPVNEARSLVKDLFTPKPVIYWADFLFHAVIGWTAFVGAILATPFSAAQLAAMLVAALALYRAAIFTHELAHLKRGTFAVFRWVWNFLAGFPLMIPSFTYRGVHNDHHKRSVYGTKGDGEYLPFAVEAPWHIVAYFLFSVAAPLLLAGRFILLTPFSILSPKLRTLIWRHASSLTIDLSYARPEQTAKDEGSWRLQEFFTFVYGATFVGLAETGIIPLHALLIWYFIEVSVFILNSLRTLGAHRYRNPGEHAVSYFEQYLDSVNIPGNPLVTALWAPVGLRYHATHHLFPAIPYHALGEAHRRLSTQLSDTRLYLSTQETGLLSAIRSLWKDASQLHRDTPHA
jgi:fatty acid desaturase